MNKLIHLTLFMMLSVSAQAQVLDDKLNEYRDTAGVSDFDAGRGKALWYSDNGGKSCTACHAQSPQEAGQHNKTGKPIEPMALSVNKKRFQSAEKIEKWFLRNCKWTLDRECTAQEKGDVLTWLKGE